MQLALRCDKLRSYNKTLFLTNLQMLNPDAVSSLVVRGQLTARMADRIKFNVPGIFRLGVVDIRRPKSIRYLDGI